MTIKELLTFATRKLSKSSTSPALDAEVLLTHVLDESKEYLATNPNHKITIKQEKQYNILIARRDDGHPVAYLRGHKEFLGLKFFVDKNVLIPRPETEGLVELVLDQAKKQKNLKILDIGTGSGAIIIALAKQLFAYSHELEIQYFASDISQSALAIAKRNAKFHNVKITFKQGSLLEPWKNQDFDIIVANLPYLPKETDPSTKFEPKNALIGKKKGLALFEELFTQLPLLPRPPRSIFLEIGHNQEVQIKKLAAKWLPDFKIKISNDLSGRARYAILAQKVS